MVSFPSQAAVAVWSRVQSPRRTSRPVVCFLASPGTAHQRFYHNRVSDRVDFERESVLPELADNRSSSRLLRRHVLEKASPESSRSSGWTRVRICRSQQTDGDNRMERRRPGRGSEYPTGCEYVVAK